MTPISSHLSTHLTTRPASPSPPRPEPLAGAELGPAVNGVLVAAAHQGYEALALDELDRAGFAYRNRLVTTLGELQDVVGAQAGSDDWDIVLVIDTPGGPGAAEVLPVLAGHIADTPVIVIARGAPPAVPPGLRSVRTVDLRSFAGAAADAMRENERRRERTRGARALRASEIRFATAFDSAPIGLALVQLDGRFLGVNPVFCAIAGRERTAIVAASPESVTDDDLLSCVRAAADHLATDDDAEPVERRCIRADGAPIWIRVSAAPAHGDDGETLYLVAHVEDVTARREAEEARERSDMLFRALFANSNVGLNILDSHGTSVTANQAFQEILGYTEQELQQLTFLDVTHPADVVANVSLRTRHLAEGSGFRMEKRYVKKDGSTVWTELSGAPLRDAAGRAHSIGVVVDITERRRAEAALEESARMLATAQALGGLGGWSSFRASAEAEPQIWWSPEMGEILGLDPKRDLPSIDRFYERVHPDDRAALREATLVALGDARTLDIEFRIVRPSGEVRWVRERADAFRGEGSEIRLVGVILDITAARSGDAAAPSG